MRPKNFDKKLSLQKTTVSNLDQILAGKELNVATEKSTTTNFFTCDYTLICTISRCYTQCPSNGLPCMAC